MSATPIRGFITKKEVEELYGRSHRSITRDFSSAVRVGDNTVLKHLKLRTEDEQVRDGDDVTLELIQELSNNGLTPTWYIERTWAEQRYGVRSKTAKPTSTPQPQKQSTARGEQVLVSDESELVVRLEDQIKDLKRDKDQLHQELTIKNEQIKEANERTRESNILMKELQGLLGNVQQRALLPLPNQPVKTDRTVPDVPIVQDPTPQATVTKPTRDNTPAKSSRPARKRQPTKEGTTKSKKPASRTKRKSPSQNKRKTPVPKRPPTKKTPAKSRWFETPTLSRMFSRTK